MFRRSASAGFVDEETFSQPAPESWNNQPYFAASQPTYQPYQPEYAEAPLYQPPPPPTYAAFRYPFDPSSVLQYSGSNESYPPQYLQAVYPEESSFQY